MRIRTLNNKRRGFTLVEIMVVVVVLAILAAAVLPNFIGKDEQAKSSRAKSDVASIMTMLEAFRLDMGRYPYEEEGLAALRTPPDSEDGDKWKGPYAKKSISNDPWGNPYQYILEPNEIDEVGVCSYGADGAPGGEKEGDMDICSWDEGEEGDAVGGDTGGGAPAPAN